MVWIMLVLLGTLLLAVSSIVDKKVLNSQIIHPFKCVASFGIVGIPVSLVGLVILPAPMWLLALLGIGAGLIFIPATWLYYVSIAHEEVSRIVLILRLTSPQVLLLSVLFFGEILT